MSGIAFHADTIISAKDDQLLFKRFVRPLASVLTAPSTMTPLTVGIFGPWGSGKSTMLGLLEEEINRQKSDDFLFIKFNPWTHRKEPNILVPLLHSVHDATKEKFGETKESVKKIFNVLTRLGADLLLKSITVNAVDLDKLEKLEKSYVEGRQVVESEMRKLRQTLEAWAKEIHGPDEDGRRIIFIIDDLDRCEPTEIIDVLEAIKLFLDVPHVIVILAVDKEVIDRGIEVRYSKFDFAAGRKAALGAEYLEKIVQLPITLPPLGGAEIDRLLGALGVQKVMPEQAKLLAELVPPNPRKIKRIVNMIALTKAIIAETPEPLALDLQLSVRLAVIQVQDSQLYEEICRRPTFLRALQIYYTDQVAKTKTNFSEFGTNGEAFEKLCKTYFVSGGYLEKIFSGAPFAGIMKDEKQIALYLNLTVPRKA